VCFATDVTKQRYYVGESVINVCHFNPLAGYWRKLFCSAASQVRLDVPHVTRFCDDACYYQGQRLGDASCRAGAEVLSGPLDADPSFDDIHMDPNGLPAPLELESRAAYRFNYGRSVGNWQTPVVFVDATLPHPSFTIVGHFRTGARLPCQTIIRWASAHGHYAMLTLKWGQMVWAEKVHGTSFVKSSEMQLTDGAWHQFAMLRLRSGGVSMFVDGKLAHVGHINTRAPRNLPKNPTTTGYMGCTLNGEVRDLQIFHHALSQVQIWYLATAL